MKTLSKSMEVKICDICLYTYMPAVVGDNALHRKYHDEFVHGVRAKTSKSDWVLEQLDDLKIILISPNSPDIQRPILILFPIMPVRLKKANPLSFLLE
jgi:hypothetical protein